MLKFCPHQVYEVRETEEKKLIVKNPNNCVVFCRACGKTCGVDAISFPNKTICLPLFLAGGVEERGFAEKFPTISVDGCSKACAKRATEKYSGKVSAAIDVTDIIGKDRTESAALSTRNLTDEHKALVEKVVNEITVKFDEVLRAAQRVQVAKGLAVTGPFGDCSCSCGKK